MTIYLDNETATRLSDAAHHDQKSRSAWASDAIRQCLPQRKFPQWWFDLFGTWEDDRTAEEIIADIRAHAPQAERASFDE